MSNSVDSEKSTAILQKKEMIEKITVICLILQCRAEIYHTTCQDFGKNIRTT